MVVHSITLTLPDTVYTQIQQAAAKVHRPVNDVLTEAVTAVVPVLVDPTLAHLRSALAQMAYLNDAALWQAARATLSLPQRERLAALHDAQQRDILTPEERVEEQALLALYRDTLLVRAHAAVLLQQRGYDITDPEQFAPLV